LKCNPPKLPKCPHLTRSRCPGPSVAILSPFLDLIPLLSPPDVRGRGGGSGEVRTLLGSDALCSFSPHFEVKVGNTAVFWHVCNLIPLSRSYPPLNSPGIQCACKLSRGASRLFSRNMTGASARGFAQRRRIRPRPRAAPPASLCDTMLGAVRLAKVDEAARPGPAVPRAAPERARPVCAQR
jgi:hypothetical protein